MAGLNALTVNKVEMPIINSLSRQVELRRGGGVKRLLLPRWAEDALSVALLDYTLFVWHVLTHRSRWLWRLHQVHHADLDLDASTALRFHFVEMVVSVPWRAAQVLVIGVSPRALSMWQQLLMASILFHHSNVRLPARFERALSWLVMTPRLHGIHHASDPALRDTNWSSGLALWDVLHGTRKTDVPQESIRIGIEGFTQPDQVRLGRMLELPFVRGSESPGEAEPATGLEQD
jgi:sterol desaturase/sphingolipid hydroxylase (fatty acid hydroxylase superfamily)